MPTPPSMFLAYSDTIAIFQVSLGNPLSLLLNFYFSCCSQYSNPFYAGELAVCAS